MSIWENVWIALDNLRLNKMRSFLTIIGIVVGVGAVVTVVSIGQAGKSSVISSISKYGDSFFVVLPNPQNDSGLEDISITTRDLDQVRKLSGVKEAAGVLSFPMQSKLGKETLNFTITGTSSELTKMENMKLAAGRFFTSSEERAQRKVVVVESKFADEQFGSPQAALQRKIPLDGKIYQIVGVFETEKGLLSGLGGNNYSAYMPLEAIPVSYGSSNVRLNYIQLQSGSDDPQELNDAIDRVKKLLAKRHNTDVKSYMSQTGKEAQQQVGAVFNILQTIIGSIAGISLFVGGIGVMNIMLVSVTERTREIGIRKAIGATPGVIMAQFIIESVILSFIGGLIGTMLGLFGAFLFAQITSWPFLVSWWAILLAFGFSAAVGIFFGLYPANKAARMQPIESLRYE